MEEFVATHYVTGNMAVAGVGVDHDTLTELVNKMPVREGRKPTVLQKATYYGGDVQLLLTFQTYSTYIISVVNTGNEVEFNTVAH